jgi:hypothetical protein
MVKKSSPLMRLEFDNGFEHLSLSDLLDTHSADYCTDAAAAAADDVQLHT